MARSPEPRRCEMCGGNREVRGVSGGPGNSLRIVLCVECRREDSKLDETYGPWFGDGKGPRANEKDESEQGEQGEQTDDGEG